MKESHQTSAGNKRKLTQPQQIEIERLAKLPPIPDAPEEEDAAEGVLLSDRIERLCQKYSMIAPFDPANLKAASYEICVGSFYGRAGRTFELKEDQSLTIEPFDVVIIQSYETLNLPRFVIARWNIRIRWAYRGLLWVGAPQVDPGFRGFLSCPLYNLSNKPVTIKFKEPIAAMDFVPTSNVTEKSRSYDWAGRTRIVFSDYEQDGLESALYTMAAKGIKEVGEKAVKLETAVQDQNTTIATYEAAQKANTSSLQTLVEKKLAESEDRTASWTQAIQSRVDSYTTNTFTVLAVVMAALGVVVSRSPEFSYFNAGVYVAAIALWFGLRAMYRASVPADPASAQGRTLKVWIELGFGIILFSVLVFAQIRSTQGYQADLAQLKNQNTDLQRRVSDAERQIGTLQTSVASQAEIQNRFSAIQAQVDSIRAKK